MKYLFFIILINGVSASIGSAATRTHLGDGGYLIELGTGFSFTDSKASEMAGAQFTKKYTHAQVLSGAFSFPIFKGLLFGLRYSSWFAGQKYSLSGATLTDTLLVHELGVQIGYQVGNPRVRYRVIAGVAYPAGLKVVQEGSSNQTFTPISTPLLFDARIQIILKLSQTVSLLMESGYRRADLGFFKSSGKDYIPSGATLNLSGPFVGTGIGIHF